ncbi:winged helix-turn-helix domain-containing protein [Aneurinibacillus migulanus]|uniref:winged helix-turn-helix domain-containing protein n=1 Tax=Aneurinibacillus migulanus TaxID=47500 RepID=UPI0020A1315E|nr:winged helix-turn-helix domain-containing protein [Aneurinibacillus migulanus]MCP1357017.1 winged helix-turn-helix domain-containing protein [Aneurinibacillus migulanus]
MKFFLNTEAKGYLRSLAEEFGESTNAVRVELNRLAEAGLLESENEGRTKVYRANKKHMLFGELHSIVKKYVGIDRLIEDVLSKLGNVELAFITGDYARGIDSGIIDLVIIGEIDELYLQSLIVKVEELIGRKIQSLVLNGQGFKQLNEEIKTEKMLIVWNDKKALWGRSV